MNKYNISEEDIAIIQHRYDNVKYMYSQSLHSSQVANYYGGQIVALEYVCSILEIPHSIT